MELKHGLRIPAAPSGTAPVIIVPEGKGPIKISLEQVADLLQPGVINKPHSPPDEALADAASRIQDAANLHALASDVQNDGRQTVALDDFLHALTEHFVDGVAGQSPIVLLVNVDPVQVPVRVAGMLSQIVNEFVAAVRHEFTPTRRGTIQVECGIDADGAIMVRVGTGEMSDIEGFLRVRLGRRGPRIEETR